jgi:NADPH:quinone reductase-like Zn-dependent oxidoreductase
MSGRNVEEEQLNDGMVTGLMPKAVRFDDYGGIDVLEVRDVPRPEPGPDQVLVAVRAAGINISEAKIREGTVRKIFPATFPSGEGSDLAGVVEEVGAGVNGVAVGDEVIGFTNNRASHADYVLVEAANLAPKRIDTTVDFPAITKYGVKGEGGAAAASAATLAELAKAIAAGDLVVPIQRTNPLDDVRAAFTELEAGHVAGKIVLIP